MWKSLKQRLGFKAMGCCGATWTPAIPVPDPPTATQLRHKPVTLTVTANAAPAQMNLATALAAERNSREAGPNRVKTLMTLIDETEGGDLEGKREGTDGMCCVCMDRRKGAAFIPCGHAFCRVCSRELWVNRGSCPVCNRSIIEILDLF